MIVAAIACTVSVVVAIAAVAGVLWAVASFLVPHTPPNKEAPDPWAFLKAFNLFRTVPGFTAFILISLVASAEFQFFYPLSGQFLGSLGAALAAFTIPASLAAAQAAIEEEKKAPAPKAKKKAAKKK